MTDFVLDAAALKAEALRLGAADVGLAEAGRATGGTGTATDADSGPDVGGDLATEWPFLQAYLAAEAHGGMHYLSRSPETRCHPDFLLPGVRTVVVCAFSYFPRPDLYAYHPRIAYFAQGEDYHRVIRRALKQLAAYVNRLYPTARCHGFVDTAPILEKAWAVRAGLGRIGRNNLLQHPRLGSYLFLGLLLIDRPADAYDRPTDDIGKQTDRHPTEACPPSSLLPDTCLRCRACVDACPTGALSYEGRPRLHAARCLSYVTIEARPTAVSGAAMPASGQPSAPAKTFPPLRTTDAAPPPAIFGCDRCQSVCPANRRLADAAATPTHKLPEPHPAFVPDAGLAAMTRDDFARLDEAAFRQRFARSPLKRAGADGLRANLALWES